MIIRFWRITLNCHWHHEYEYGVVLTGELDYFLNGTKLKLKKGDCIFVNANVLHMAEQSAGCSKAVMYIVAFPYMLLTSNMESTIYRKYFNPLIENGISGFQIFRILRREVIFYRYWSSCIEFSKRKRTMNCLALVWCVSFGTKQENMRHRRMYFFSMKK